jgi:hypothetical protein
VRGNPSNFIDPSGTKPNECDICNFTADGYSEGFADTFTGEFHIWNANGKEIVYDFATMERASFSYEIEPLFSCSFDPDDCIRPGYATGILEKVKSFYFLTLHHFDSLDSVDNEYSGRFEGLAIGVNTPGIEIGAGWMWAWSHGGDDGPIGGLQVTGNGPYYLVGLGLDLPVVASDSVLATNYTVDEGSQVVYTLNGSYNGYVTEQMMQLMQKHIRFGRYAHPEPRTWPVIGGDIFNLAASTEREKAASNLKNTWDQHRTYFEEFYAQCHNQQ